MEVVTLKEGTHRGYWWGKRIDVPEGRGKGLVPARALATATYLSCV